MDHEAGGEYAPPPSGPTGATTEALGAHAAPGSAASGMAKRVSGKWRRFLKEQKLSTLGVSSKTALKSKVPDDLWAPGGV
eukprot:1156467-Pelagomonas_calceolata.AAC.2